MTQARYDAEYKTRHDCYYCGRTVVASQSAGRALCEICKEIKARERNEKRRLRYWQKESKLKIVVVVKDPDEDFGFFPGATFSVSERDYGLAKSIFTPGTLIRNGGALMRVVNGSLSQHLEYVDD
jgi:hypothetical protein